MDEGTKENKWEICVNVMEMKEGRGTRTARFGKPVFLRN
jgi:hypothetical protein